MIATSDDLADLVSALEAAGCAVRGKSVVCAFHGDSNASGSIYQGPDGRWRYKCHACDAAGDAADIIARHTGRPLAEVLREWAPVSDFLPRAPAKPTPAPLGGPTPFKDLDRLAATCYQATPEAVYCYQSPTGADLLAVLRLPGKSFRQAVAVPGGWMARGMSGGLPIYRQPELAAADPAAVVVVTEGEKDADSLHALGILVTTAPMGADSRETRLDNDGKPGKATWGLLAGRSVVLWGDDDEPGQRHMARVARILGRLKPAPALRVVRSEDRHGCKDAADLIHAHGPEVARQAVAQAVPWAEPKAEPEPLPFDLRRFADTPLKVVDWLWPGVLPRGMSALLAGAGGLGKSFLVCDLAARVSTGRPMPDGSTPPAGRVLLLSREDDAACVLLPRLVAAGADLGRVDWSTFSDAESGAPLDLAERVNALADAAKVHQWALVVIDTFAAFASTGTDANSAGDVRVLLNALARLASATGAAVLTVAHLRKSGQGEGSAADAVAGSAQMVAGVRVVAMLEPGRSEGARWLRVVKSNLMPPEAKNGWIWHFTMGPAGEDAPRIVWSEAGPEYGSLEADRQAGRASLDPAEVRAALLPIIAKRPMPVQAAADRVWRELRSKPGHRGLKKADVVLALDDLAADPGLGLEAGTGPKGARLLGLPGSIPESPEVKARRLAVPGMTVRALADAAGCRTEVASRILRDHGFRVSHPDVDGESAEW